MKLKMLKDYQYRTSFFKKGTEPDVDRQTGKMLIKLQVAKEKRASVLDVIVELARKQKYKSKNRKK